jgi:hypothetical protein
MKKLVLLGLAALLLLGCAKKEKTGLHQVLVDRFSEDQDLKDYKLDPANVADCVIDEISSTLPGFAGDPRRAEFFTAYERFLAVKSAADAEAAVAEFERLFGSRQKAREAALGITDHIMTCMGKAIENAPTDGHRVSSGGKAP